MLGLNRQEAIDAMLSLRRLLMITGEGTLRVGSARTGLQQEAPPATPCRRRCCCPARLTAPRAMARSDRRP